MINNLDSDPITLRNMQFSVLLTKFRKQSKGVNFLAEYFSISRKHSTQLIMKY